MSWDNPTTDMAHCTWCSWDLRKEDATDMMHPQCAIKADRRNALREELIPVLIELGITKPDYNNLLTDICRRIENELAIDEEQT